MNYPTSYLKSKLQITSICREVSLNCSICLDWERFGLCKMFVSTLCVRSYYQLVRYCFSSSVFVTLSLSKITERKRLWNCQNRQTRIVGFARWQHPAFEYGARLDCWQHLLPMHNLQPRAKNCSNETWTYLDAARRWCGQQLRLRRLTQHRCGSRDQFHAPADNAAAVLSHRVSPRTS